MCDAKSESAYFHTDIDGLQAVHSLSVSTALRGSRNLGMLFVSKPLTRLSIGPLSKIDLIPTI